MTPRLCLLLAPLIACSSFAADEPPAPKQPANRETPAAGALTAEQQKAQIARRTSGAMVGSFAAFSSLLYAAYDVTISADDDAVREARLSSPYPDFYQPTFAEVFDVIARQTQTSWKYDPKTSSWKFSAPALPLPFTFDLAKGWKSENRGNYLFCKPPTAPVGMDIYALGAYSSDPADPALAGKLREAAAILFAQNFKKDVTAKDMTVVKIGDYETLHFSTPAPKPGLTWRQWAIAEGGQIIVMVSAIQAPNEAAVLPDVEAMAKTLKIVPAKR